MKYKYSFLLRKKFGNFRGLKKKKKKDLQEVGKLALGNSYLCC